MSRFSKFQVESPGNALSTSTLQIYILYAKLKQNGDDFVFVSRNKNRIYFKMLVKF